MTWTVFAYDRSRCLVVAHTLSRVLSWHHWWQQSSWWRHQMEAFSTSLAICVGNSPVTGEFPTQRPVTRSFDVFFDLRLNKRLSKQSVIWWFVTPLRPLWRHCNVVTSDNFWCNPDDKVRIMAACPPFLHTNFVVIGGTRGYRYDNQQCNRWRQSWHFFTNIFIQVKPFADRAVLQWCPVSNYNTH